MHEMRENNSISPLFSANYFVSHARTANAAKHNSVSACNESYGRQCSR